MVTQWKRLVNLVIDRASFVPMLVSGIEKCPSWRFHEITSECDVGRVHTINELEDCLASAGPKFPGLQSIATESRKQIAAGETGASRFKPAVSNHKTNINREAATASGRTAPESPQQAACCLAVYREKPSTTSTGIQRLQGLQGHPTTCSSSAQTFMQ